VSAPYWPSGPSLPSTSAVFFGGAGPDDINAEGQIFARTGRSAPIRPPLRPSIQCSNTIGHRVVQGAQGVTNLALAGLKTAAVGTTDVLLAAAAPETGGASLLAAGAITTYGVTSISGQALAGAGQLYSALTGDAAGEDLSQAGDILGGPVSGLGTLVVAGNASLAQRNANIESTFTAGAGLLRAPNLKERIASGIDTALGMFGLSGAGCHR